MKTKFYWVALLASAAMIAQANAGGHHGGGGGGFGGGGRGAPGGGGVRASSFGPRGNFGGGRFMGPGPRFSSYRGPMGYGQGRFGGSDRAFGRSRQLAAGMSNRRFDASRTFNQRENRFTRNGNNFGNRFEDRGSNAARNHLFAQRSADWHRDWDRNRDHFWRGHRCRFVNGEWFIFDTGFDPYDHWYPYGYPYDGYAYNYYPYGYDAGAYEGDADYYNQGAYDSSDRSSDSTVAAAQEQLAGQGYYHGEVDGIFGPETRRAITRYQSDHGLGVTGRLNTDTLHVLGVRQVASN
ncbi:MAG: hypothetical protein QOH24_240 [Verrucomicrobiota bacterium]